MIINHAQLSKRSGLLLSVVHMYVRVNIEHVGRHHHHLLLCSKQSGYYIHTFRRQTMAVLVQCLNVLMLFLVYINYTVSIEHNERYYYIGVFWATCFDSYRVIFRPFKNYIKQRLHYVNCQLCWQFT